MARTDYYDDPAAPKVNSVVPAVTAFVQDARGRILMERRTDNGRWGLPGGTHQAGESIVQTVVREVAEETGLTVAVERMVGIYTDPRRVIAFSDGEVRQEFSMCFAAHVVSGELRKSSESFEVGWIAPEDLGQFDIAPTTRMRIEDALSNQPGTRLA
jgi:ADP-ribose pyrophosphatase YjhB (NUDIX family)